MVTCIGTNDNAFVLTEHSEAEVVLLVRPIAHKLLRASYSVADSTISVDSAISGTRLFSVPYDHCSRMTWGCFTEIVNNMCNLPNGRVVLFPEDVVEPEDMDAWKTKPLVRVQVRSLLKVTAKEQQGRKICYVRKKGQPSTSAALSAASTSASSTS